MEEGRIFVPVCIYLAFAVQLQLSSINISSRKMDSAINFFPLWEEVTMMSAPMRELHDLRRKMMEKFITDHPEDAQLPPSTEGRLFALLHYTRVANQVS